MIMKGHKACKMFFWLVYLSSVVDVFFNETSTEAFVNMVANLFGSRCLNRYIDTPKHFFLFVKIVLGIIIGRLSCSGARMDRCSTLC